ncbi:glycosyltransferase [Falsirhodobacter algicola]|uniref:Rhamnosyl transferase n=1 Tax=Falsirhodobacter algicola TaxID=2692330 RepID=A0A8J8MS40_9RHOB|nr:glycosyltransferase [Falsirhodobacter algicola]QUS35686.1 hypothetical protein GR316_05020 [Falsirhodobacter algicola]
MFGVTRFNLVTQRTLGSFRATKGKTLEEAKALVFRPESLQKRLEMFKAFCLSTYRELSANRDNLHGLILISEDLPQPFRDQLEEACADVPHVLIVPVADDQGSNDVVPPIVHRIAGTGRVYTFRYDDDDALPRDYADKVEKIAASIAPGTVISFNNGFSISRVGEDAYGFRIRRYPLNAFGLGILSDMADLKTVFQLGPHTKITLPVHHDTTSIGYACTVHADNDSRVGEMKSEIVSGDHVIAQMQDLFPHITAEGLKVLTFRRPSDFEPA